MALKIPLDSKAVQAADQELYKNHPELGGRKLTMAPEDAQLRKEWVALYAKHSSPGKSPAPPPAKKKPADPVAPCPPSPNKSIKGHFREVLLKCGDLGHLQAFGMNLAFGAGATFRIYRDRDLAALGTECGSLAPDTLTLPWKVKKPRDNQRGDRYVFEVSADGVSAISSNQSQFFDYPNYGPQEKTVTCKSGWLSSFSGKFDIMYESHRDQLTIVIRIKLVNRNGPKPEKWYQLTPGVVEDANGDYVPVEDAVKAHMKLDIEAKLSNKLKLYREGCVFGDNCECGKPIRIVVQFVESGEHHEVNLFQGRSRADSENWTRVKTRGNTFAHETGHLLGWYDEYPENQGGTLGSPPRWKENEPTHLMNVGLTVPPEYAWDFRDWLAQMTGEKWKVKPA